MEPRRVQPIVLSTKVSTTCELTKPCVRFVLELEESNQDTYPEISYTDLMKNAVGI